MYIASSAVPAWSFRMLPGDTIVSNQYQMTNILNHLHADLELRFPVIYFTFRFRPFPITTGLGEVVKCTCPSSLHNGRFEWNAVLVVMASTLYTRGSAAMA
jgi:hypothetical protein